MASVVIQDVSRRYGKRWAVARLSLEIGSGEAWMLTGPNGSGKSTLIRCLATALKPHHGRILLGGRPLWEDRAALRGEIAYFGHHLQLYEDLSADDNLAVWARLGSYRPDRSALLERVGLDPGRRDPVRTFSAGMRRRLALARMLLKRPRLVLLDEPFGALDPAGRELMASVVRELNGGGATVVLATHLPSVARTLCDHRLALESGRATYAGPVEGEGAR